MGNNKIIYSGKLTVRYSMYDFIKAVRERPVLWNRKHPQFHMRDKREIAWHEVSNKVSHEFASATTEEKNKMVDTLVKRWKNTRDCFLRSYRAQENKECDSSTRRYIYDNELKFLLETKTEPPTRNRKRKAQSLPTRSRSLRNSTVVKKSRHDANQQHNDFDTEFENLCLEVGDIVNLGENIKAETMQSAAKNNEDSIIASRSESVTEENRFEGDKSGTYLEAEAVSIINTTNQSTNVQSGKEAETEVNTPKAAIDKYDEQLKLNADADQCFFDSIKPIMRLLSVDVKLDFQIEVLKLLKHFRNKDNIC